MNHLCCVFARIISVNPLEIEDKSGRILLGVSPTKHCKIGDYCYVLIDTCSLPPRCTRLTVVPESLKTVAEYQLQLARNRANERSNQRVCADDQFDNAFSADQKQEMDIDERDDAARFTTPTTAVKMETN
ncbi:unnamed protein product [Anisakis simplex]|uniref:Uncharacterized protein n=1 Tax=Anisakis simplex TaxID=6269 RepID=A0A3P6T0X6_ANISI|nr:unnamed protein product [Anisakis simplex]